MRILISNSSSQPIYEQIVEQIKALILKNELNEGEVLPSIRNLAKELGISVITTKRAYEELEREGFTETVRGKGTFVAPQNKELMRETKLKIIEEKLSEAVNESKILGLTWDEIVEMLKILYED
ncbi:GntR family transcriptional regulator [Clostridium botulinum]|uniref:GntR family transcriptional regulator n=1 Tax=Clostridium botulinum TaxID=1491 RepID=A0A9Q1UWM3_CLOBO|nr:GntR family transcriptional regulator [Clostridium botulinum]AEB76448.1 transcriptional regulator, GntR family [Clostridium botulinum BKT015925]KEI01045.1 GntR family transcriptional regulator [Clostridium botulinum D str. 16868]KEI04774.1 GntR family transcriptional regulator [Clostridium botulinum C/D str. Sp77]KLU75987.1 GntR family transcriptional regulator [Clostridium botulinum V891]KOA74890.1 GntR family transcriptional regulator [Clostridium botulinum]